MAKSGGFNKLVICSASDIFGDRSLRSLPSFVKVPEIEEGRMEFQVWRPKNRRGKIRIRKGYFGIF